MKPLILASESLLRQKILTDLKIPFIAEASGIDETLYKEYIPEKLPELLARKKAESIAIKYSLQQAYFAVLAADTVIVCNEVIYGKPSDCQQARKYLQELNGKTHKVITAISLYNFETKSFSQRVNSSKVTLAHLSDSEIEAYLSTEEWHNAAGAYRIQGIASCFISHIEGSYSSIAGLPIFELYDILREQNYSVLN